MNPYVSCDLCSISSSSSSSKSDATEDRSSPTCIAPYLTTVEPGKQPGFDKYMPFLGVWKFYPPKAHQTKVSVVLAVAAWCFPCEIYWTLSLSHSLSCCFSSLRVPIWASWGVKLILPQWVSSGQLYGRNHPITVSSCRTKFRSSFVGGLLTSCWMLDPLRLTKYQSESCLIAGICRYTHHKQK